MRTQGRHKQFTVPSAPWIERIDIDVSGTAAADGQVQVTVTFRGREPAVVTVHYDERLCTERCCAEPGD